VSEENEDLVLEESERKLIDSPLGSIFLHQLRNYESSLGLIATKTFHDPLLDRCSLLFLKQIVHSFCNWRVSTLIKATFLEQWRIFGVFCVLFKVLLFDGSAFLAATAGEWVVPLERILCVRSDLEGPNVHEY
jgi:hypothetical protein